MVINNKIYVYKNNICRFQNLENTNKKLPSFRIESCQHYNTVFIPLLDYMKFFQRYIDIYTQTYLHILFI